MSSSQHASQRSESLRIAAHGRTLRPRTAKSQLSFTVSMTSRAASEAPSCRQDVKDNHDEAATAAQEALKLCQWVRTWHSYGRCKPLGRCNIQLLILAPRTLSTAPILWHNLVHSSHRASLRVFGLNKASGNTKWLLPQRCGLHAVPCWFGNLPIPDEHIGRRLLTVIPHLPQLEESEDWVDHVDNIVTRFEEETGRRPIYSVMFY